MILSFRKIRNISSWLRFALQLFQIFTGRHTELFLEHFGEVFWCGETHTHAEFHDFDGRVLACYAARFLKTY